MQILDIQKETIGIKTCFKSITHIYYNNLVSLSQYICYVFSYYLLCFIGYFTQSFCLSSVLQRWLKTKERDSSLFLFIGMVTPRWSVSSRCASKPALGQNR